MTIVIDMSLIWPKYGWDVDPQVVARKLGISYSTYINQINRNMGVFLDAVDVPDVLPDYVIKLSDYVADDDIMLQL